MSSNMGWREERRGSRNDPIIMKGEGPRDLLGLLIRSSAGDSAISLDFLCHGSASGGKIIPLALLAIIHP